jgi:NTE family protein
MTIASERTLASTLFHLLRDDVWSHLRERMAQRAFEPGERIVSQGELEPDFHVIVDGTAAVRARTPHGEERELGRLGFGECVGEMSLLTGEPASADVMAITRTVTYALSQRELTALGELRSELIEALSTILAARLKHANERLLARRTANTHIICSGAADLTLLAGLGDAVARTTGVRVLTLLAGDALRNSAGLVAANRSQVQTLADAELEELPAILARVSDEFDDIVMFGDERSLHRIAADAASLLHVVRDVEGHFEPSAHTSLGQVIAITGETWTVPALRRLSERLQRPVVAALSDRPESTAAIGRLARVITRRTVGVAFGAGAAKGLGHLGVLRAIGEMSVPIDAVAGCSIGAAVAAGVASGMTIDDLTESTLRAAKRAIRPALPARSFLSSSGIRDELKRLAGDRCIEDLDLPTAIVATDLYRRTEINFTSGLLWPRLLASMAIPGVYAPVPGLESFLVDGGVLNPVPVRQCRELGAGIVIGVRLTATRTSPRDRLDRKPGNPYALETIMRTFEIMLNRISEVSHEHADINIEVCVDGTGGIRDFSRGREIAELCYRSAWSASARIGEVLPYSAARPAT